RFGGDRAQSQAVDLAGGIAWQGVDHADVARDLVARQAFVAVAEQRARIDRHAAVGGDDEGDDPLAEALVGRADRGDLEHALEAVDDFRDLPGTDVVAAGDDHFLLAVDDDQEAVLVDATDVAGPQPAPAKGLRGQLRLAEVAAGDPGATQQQ